MYSDMDEYYEDVPRTIEITFRYMIFKLKKINRNISVLNAKVFIPCSRPFENYTNGVLYKCADLFHSVYGAQYSDNPIFPVVLTYELSLGMLIYKFEYIHSIHLYDGWDKMDVNSKYFHYLNDGSQYFFIT